MKTPDYKLKANARYDEKNVDKIYLRVPKGKRQIIKNRAIELKTSVNAYINNLIEKDLNEHN